MINFVVRALVEFTVIRQSCAVLVLSSSGIANVWLQVSLGTLPSSLKLEFSLTKNKTHASYKGKCLKKRIVVQLTDLIHM